MMRMVGLYSESDSESECLASASSTLLCVDSWSWRSDDELGRADCVSFSMWVEARELEIFVASASFIVFLFVIKLGIIL